MKPAPNVLRGELTHPAVAEALGKPFVDPYGAWGKGAPSLPFMGVGRRRSRQGGEFKGRVGRSRHGIRLPHPVPFLGTTLPIKGRDVAPHPFSPA